MKFLQKLLKEIALIGILVITSGVVIAGVVLASHSMNELNNATNSNDEIRVTLLNNAGVMIEAEDTRIYIDPYNLSSNYSDYPADAIFITHNHGDHYDITSIDLIRTNDTSFYFPAVMIVEIFRYGANPVVPEDTFEINDFNVRCFYMYTMPGSDQSSHPREFNYTSYIIEINGFAIFHAGDSWNIDEYVQLSGEIDLVLLPLGPGCQTMTEIDVVSVIATIDPSYFIPIHFTEEVKESFIDQYNDTIEGSGCDIIDLDSFESYTFDPPDITIDPTDETTDNITTDDTTNNTTTDIGSNTPGFSLSAAILAGVCLLIWQIKKKKYDSN
ncbi:MAG: MBL fold metallo-hydrolase [Candidatus Heimdallarchaeota archaeon]|nr:MAG: MBL fold metallo-hydrolase [Candidatus Heimdallarchaeota archaeon]